MLSKCPGKKDIFKELHVRFVIFRKIIIADSFFVSNNFVSEGKLAKRACGHTCLRFLDSFAVLFSASLW